MKIEFRDFCNHLQPDVDVDSTAVFMDTLDYFPSEETTQKLVHICFEIFERSLRILHRQTFLKLCEAFWSRINEAVSPWSDREPIFRDFKDFIPQLVLVILLASTLASEKCLDHSHT